MRKLGFTIALLSVIWVGYKVIHPNQKSAQNSDLEPVFTKHYAQDGEYSYEYVSGDVLKARIYTLRNGLKVYLSVYNDAPRVQTYIAVKAGSKFDPADATGLAHYLEHMVFKGTSKLGTKDFVKENLELQKIEELYEKYRSKTDSIERKNIYHQIDSISGVASSLSIAQEYDKALENIGATGTNAYTSFEQTVYINDIPSNELEKWLQIESERFSELVLRLFHTELEAVYEEKNRSLDNDRRKTMEILLSNLFLKHPYGTQTTIGTIEHLKNPSMKKIHQYFKNYYIPNNMAICLSGNFEPEQAIRLIDKYFGKIEPKPLQKIVLPVEPPITSSKEITIYGQDAAFMQMGFRLPGIKNEDIPAIELINDMLSNAQAGLIDINLNQKQKVLRAGCYPMILNDNSVHLFYASPREGQSLSELKDLLLEQIAILKKGEFPEWLMKAIVVDKKVQQFQQYENNSGRAHAFVEAFTSEMNWSDYAAYIHQIEKITKEQVIKVANKYYNDNYVVVYKQTGKDTSVIKVIKPKITPVAVNREEQSPFLKKFIETPTPRISPVFIDYKKDINVLKLKNNTPVLYKKNEENPVFNLYYIYEMGKNVDPTLELAIKYLQYIGTDKYTPEQFQQEMYKLGCTYNVFVSNDELWVSLSGLEENMSKSLDLFEQLLSHAKADENALKDMIEGILKSRKDAKLAKNTILSSAMLNYARYGHVSPFTNVQSEEDLQSLNCDQLIFIINGLNSIEHEVLFYGSTDEKDIVTLLNEKHALTDKLFPVPASKKFEEKETKENIVYWVDYKDMVQAELMFYNKSDIFNKDILPVSELYNEYFGSGMSSIVFQELRESKALAYSVYSRYRLATRKNESNYTVSYIGTQSDKLEESMNGMLSLLDNIPQSEILFTNAKQALMGQLETERITKSDILFSYISAKKRGLDYDIRKDTYSMLDKFTLNDIISFNEQYVKNKKRILLVLGSKEKLNFKVLRKYGQVQELGLKEIFGY